MDSMDMQGTVILLNDLAKKKGAQNLRQGIVMTTSFETRVSQMGLGSFVDINIFVVKYYFIYFLHILHFFKSLKSKSTQMLKPQKGNSRV